MKSNRKLLTVALVIILMASVGCAKKANTTPQYQAAVANDRVSVVLNVLCKQEINFKASVPPDVHKAIAQKCLQSATLDDQVTTAIANGDFTSASGYIDLATTAVQGIGSDLLSIKDPTTQQALLIAQTAALGALQTWKATVQQMATTKKAGTQ